MFKHKRLAAIVISLMMVLSLIPAMAFAAGGGGGGTGGTGSGGNSGSSSSLVIKVNDIENPEPFSITRWGDIELTPKVYDSENDVTEEYTITWQKKPAEIVNFVKDGVELKNDIPDNKKSEKLSANSIRVKGLVVGTVTITIVATKTTDSTVTQSTDVKVNVVGLTNGYGPQGSNVDATIYQGGPQTVEIVKIGDKNVTGDDIIGTKGENAPGVTFENTISNPISVGEDTNITFFIGKQMSLPNFKDNETYFKGETLKNITLLDENGKKIGGLSDNSIELVGTQNIDRSVTIKLPTGQLDAGDYILVFGQDLKVKENGGQPLGTDVKFKFTVKESAKDPAPVIGDDGVMSKVVIDKKNFEITPELKEKGIATNEEVIDAMYAAIYKELGLEADENNTVVYDIKLQISTDGGKTWIDATKENFPKEGIKLELDYPEGTNAEDQDFTVMHMVTADVNGFKAGDIENLDVTEAKDKLKMTVYSLSPFSITWEDVEDGAAKNDSSAKTGDDMNIALYAGIMLVALCGGAAVFVRRRKEQ